MVACANGCSLLLFKAIIFSNICSSEKLAFAGTTFSTEGFPSVTVPVLSMMTISMVFIFSRDSAFLMSTPDCAPLPTPTITDMGVASPNAQGQAIIKTAIAFTNA